MKKSYFPFLFVAFTAFTLTFSSCQKDEEETQPTPAPTHEVLDNYVKGLDGVSLLSDETYTLDEVMDKVLNCGMFTDVGEMAGIITNLVRTQMMDTMSAWNHRFGMNATEVRVRCVKFLYPTIDQNGNPVTLSSYATWAYPLISNPQEKVIHNRIILFCPYSQTKESFCATATFGGAASAMVTKDALIVSPDPQGFGYNKDHDQMYMNHELIGIQMADAMAAGYKIFMELGFQLAGDFYLTPMGMSQGASTAVATHRYLESTQLTIGSESHPLAEWWKLGYTFTACGPYSPEITMNEYLSWQTFAHPGVIPLVLKTMILSYPEIYGNNTEEDLYADNYLVHKAYFDSLYLYKPYSIKEINEIMFEMVSTPEHQISNPQTMVLTDMISSELLESGSELNQKMRQSLGRNDLTKGWTPKHNIYIYASENDDYVPYENAKALQRMNSSKVHLVGTDQNEHEMSCVVWMLNAFTGTYDSQLAR